MKIPATQSAVLQRPAGPRLRCFLSTRGLKDHDFSRVVREPKTWGLQSQSGGANVKPASEPAPVLKNSPNSFTFGPPEVKLKYEALAPGFDQQAEEKSSRAFSRYEGKL